MRKIIILGAGGHAREVLDVLQPNHTEEIAFFDNTSAKEQGVYGTFRIVKHAEDLGDFDAFYVGVGGCDARRNLSLLAEENGLKRLGVRAESVKTGAFDLDIDETVDMMENVIVSSSVSIGAGTLLNRNVNIHHDVCIGPECEIAPGATLLGNVTLGRGVFVGSGAIILPGVSVANNSIIGAGSVVTKDVMAAVTVVGVPATLLNKGSKKSIN